MTQRKISTHYQVVEERERFFSVGADLLSIGTFEGSLTWVSPSWEKTLGWTTEELTSHPWLYFVHPEDHEKTLSAGQELIAGVELVSFENRSNELNDSEQLVLSGIKVLVVDDEPDARELIRCVLEDALANVITAGSAIDALKLVEQEAPDILISDIGMPDEDGYEFIRKVRSLPSEKGGKIPVVALTAYARPEDRKRALVAGYQMYITKPVEPSELLAVVSSLTSLIQKN